MVLMQRIKLLIQHEQMTRSELTAALSQRFPQLVQKDAEMAVSELLFTISSALVEQVAEAGF